jgi:hypothetical protein
MLLFDISDVSTSAGRSFEGSRLLSIPDSKVCREDWSAAGSMSMTSTSGRIHDGCRLQRQATLDLDVDPAILTFESNTLDDVVASFP